jgi:hypothetical protein
MVTCGKLAALLRMGTLWLGPAQQMLQAMLSAVQHLMALLSLCKQQPVQVTQRAANTSVQGKEHRRSLAPVSSQLWPVDCWCICHILLTRTTGSQ